MSFSDAFYAVRDEVRNWGRWGDDDRLGTLNLITDEAVAHAASLGRTGQRGPRSAQKKGTPCVPGSQHLGFTVNSALTY